MTIEIMNLRTVKPSEPWDFRIDRSTPVGNPFNMINESRRDSVCDQYEKWFNEKWFVEETHSRTFFAYLQTLMAAHRNYGKLRLFCWCAPLRCHGQTIKEYLEKYTLQA